MPRYFLGADVGGTKTHVLIAEEAGRVISWIEGGPGNHETVGFPGLAEVLKSSINKALIQGGLKMDKLAGAAFGIAGYDWPSECEPILKTIKSTGLKVPFELVNDTSLGILAGCRDGWGIAVVSGTGCNCRGWNKLRTKEGRVTGGGSRMGEGAGATELVEKAIQAVAHDWTRRGTATTLTTSFVQYTGAESPEDLLEGLMQSKYFLDASVAPLILKAAETGDSVAIEIYKWAGIELGEMIKGVIRQLEFQSLEFDIVLIGSMFEAGRLLIEPMRLSVHAFAPAARFVHLKLPPVIGAIQLAMEKAGLKVNPQIRAALENSILEIPSDIIP